MKFKAGDKVAVYCKGGERNVGTIMRLDSDGICYVDTGKENELVVAHVKQCRLIKQKPRRQRVWVDFDFESGKPLGVAESIAGLDLLWKKIYSHRKRYSREFIEVKK